MANKNPKSESQIVREAENIIENYLRDRELSDIKKYYNLQEKYDRLKILSIAMIITFSMGMLISIIINQIYS